MKKYVPYIVGIVVLFALVSLGQSVMKNRKVANDEKVTVTEKVATKLVEGTVTRFFEGEQVLGYAFDIPEIASTLIERDGANVKVIGEANAFINAMYFSYEGGRGYTPADYITEVIAPNVKVVSVTGTTTIGSQEWTVAEGSTSVWHVASVKDGAWLIVAESKKGDNETAMNILDSLTVK
ncbi:MAG: hypothetical protein RI935_511 [Candidatus Parcubacteria bacterium]|jgi:hypothetical protein